MTSLDLKSISSVREGVEKLPTCRARSGVARSGVARSGVARSGVARSGVARSGVARSGVARSGVARSGVARSGVEPFGPSQRLLLVRKAAGASLLLLCLALGACAGKGKGSATASGSGSAGSGSAGSDTADGSGDTTGDPSDSGGAVAGGEDSTDSEGAVGEPGLRPPGLDMTPEEQRRAVAKHLESARKSIPRDPDAAILEARAALQADETSVDAMILLAHANYLKGNLDLAEDVLEKALKRGGDKDKQAHFLLGLIYERTERREKATPAYERALTIDPDYRSALINLGVHHLENRRYDDALRLYERLTGSLKVNTPAVWTNLGSAYRGRSADFSAADVSQRNEAILEAEKSYRRAINLDKNYSNAYYNLGLLYLDADPFPAKDGEMDRLARLKRSQGYFNEYRRLPAADLKKVDEMTAVVQKLIEKENLIRSKASERAAKKKSASEKKNDAKKPENDPKLDDSDEGFE